MPTHSAVQLCCYCFPRLYELRPQPILHVVNTDQPRHCTSLGTVQLLCTVASGALRVCGPNIELHTICSRKKTKKNLTDRLDYAGKEMEKKTHTHTHIVHPFIHLQDTSHPSLLVSEHHAVIYRRPCRRI